MLRRSFARDLGGERGHVCDLPRLGNLALPKVNDDSLIDEEVPPAALETPELRRQRASDNHTSHLHVAVDNDVQHLVLEIANGCSGVPPDRLLLLGTRRGQARWGVDDSIWVQQMIEGVEFPGVPRREPPEDDRVTRIHGVSLS